KALWQVEVKLDGGKLPEAADGIDQLDINLRPIERRFSRHGLIFNIEALQHFFQRARGQVPLLFASYEILPVVGIPGRKFGLKLIESEILQHIPGKLHATGNLLLDLLRRTENMGIVLSKTTYPQQSVHH